MAEDPFKSKSAIGEWKAKIRNTVTGLFVAAFALGAAHQLIVPLLIILGVMSALFLVRLGLSRYRGRW